METKNIHIDAGWYASYMNDEQGVCLIKTLQAKIKAHEDFLENLKGEIELFENPQEYTADVLIDSINCLLEQGVADVEINVGYFKWVG